MWADPNDYAYAHFRHLLLISNHCQIFLNCWLIYVNLQAVICSFNLIPTSQVVPVKSGFVLKYLIMISKNWFRCHIS